MNLRNTVLQVLSSRQNRRFHFLYEDLRKEIGPQLQRRQVMQVLWQLIADGLIYLDFSQPAPENWEWVLTDRGQRLVSTVEEYEPDDPEGYLTALRRNIPELDERITLYSQEALAAYNAQAYLASSVMLGVAAERSFQLLGEAFVQWLSPGEATQFKKTFENPRQTYQAKFLELRKRVEPKKERLPSEFGDNMALTLDSVLDLLRINRNEAGHPTGRRINRDTAYINLQMFARYLKQMYSLRSFFLKNVQQ